MASLPCPSISTASTGSTPPPSRSGCDGCSGPAATWRTCCTRCSWWPSAGCPASAARPRSAPGSTPSPCGWCRATGVRAAASAGCAGWVWAARLPTSLPPTPLQALESRQALELTYQLLDRSAGDRTYRAGAVRAGGSVGRGDRRDHRRGGGHHLGAPAPGASPLPQGVRRLGKLPARTARPDQLRAAEEVPGDEAARRRAAVRRSLASRAGRRERRARDSGRSTSASVCCCARCHRRRPAAAGNLARVAARLGRDPGQPGRPPSFRYALVTALILASSSAVYARRQESVRCSSKSARPWRNDTNQGAALPGPRRKPGDRRQRHPRRPPAPAPDHRHARPRCLPDKSDAPSRSRPPRSDRSAREGAAVRPARVAFVDPPSPSPPPSIRRRRRVEAVILRRRSPHPLCRAPAAPGAGARPAPAASASRRCLTGTLVPARPLRAPVPSAQCPRRRGTAGGRALETPAPRATPAAALAGWTNIAPDSPAACYERTPSCCAVDALVALEQRAEALALLESLPLPGRRAGRSCKCSGASCAPHIRAPGPARTANRSCRARCRPRWLSGRCAAGHLPAQGSGQHRRPASSSSISGTIS